MAIKKGITAGTFDLLHAGHVLMLKEAKTQCDYLIACLHVDPSIERDFKNKPIQSVRERIIQLEGCKYVDEIILYQTEEELLEIFHTMKPNVRIIGEEYKYKDFTGKYVYGMDIYYNNRKHKYSSTELRKRIKRAKKA